MIDNGSPAHGHGAAWPANDQGVLVVNRLPAKDLPGDIVQAMMAWLDADHGSLFEMLARDPFCGPRGYMIDLDSGEVIAAGLEVCPDAALIYAIREINRDRGSLTLPIALSYRRNPGPERTSFALVCPALGVEGQIFCVVPF